MTTTKWVIDAVKLGELRGVPAELVYLEDRSRRTVSMPLVMFVLRSGKRTVIVDTGGPADEEQIRSMIPFGYAVREPERIENALDRLGVDPSEVSLVVNTHLHWDHCSNNDVFPNAEVLVQQAELDFAAAPDTAHHQAYGIQDGRVPPFARCSDRIRALDGPSEITAGLGVVPLPGHSPGSQGVRVDTGDGTFVITGDCVDTFDNWDNRGAATPLPSGRFTDLPAFRASLARLKGTGWTPLPSHDHAVVEKGAFGY
ncbi:N-acyl homoserine lactonase family protein [Amycolatopsis rubida]|uniref:N-acyl homoserine lactonase family protein n=1 Tax=Amycolatopsis rubida TaxID=112413 RepID=A0ABX0C1H8_9PSEU|nr:MULTISPECIES: N-acyl homoserine lactonase family protein [Amycolatopsis]MYW96203.1 MBL fold metallo-hydrolase [Amycolatopsis rubida]NEC61194.1 N-acyl homoserine lactonase family protein [Amycolatopsis rubida]OAP24280.1 N-acyl homoserine lactonase [Amycolatopsis sp. M39]